jgi:hypothetical protein
MVLGLLAAVLLPLTAHAADCRSAFGFELNPKLTLFNLKVLLEPHSYQNGDTYMEVREFDTDFQPARGNKGGIAVVSAGGRDLSDEVTGGLVVSKYEAYFDEKQSKALNEKGGLNAVFVVGQNDECAGATFLVRFDVNGVLTVDGKRLAKVMVSPDPN